MSIEIDDIPDEDVDNIDLCPWSIAFDKSEGHLMIHKVKLYSNQILSTDL